jgi:hypothetical protein
MKSKLGLIVLVAGLMVVLQACGGGSNPGAGGKISISISPTSANLQPGETKQFTAKVTGTSNTAVSWKASDGHINRSGLYTAPNTTGKYTITATSIADPSKHAAVTISVSLAKDTGIDKTAPLGSSGWTFTAKTGEKVTFPAPGEGGSAVVGVGVRPTLPFETIDGLDWVSTAINISVKGNPDWSKDDKITITWPSASLKNQGLASQGVKDDLIAVVTFTKKTGQKIGQGYTAYANAVNSGLKTGFDFAGDAFGDAAYKDYTIGVRVVNWAKNDPFKPVQEGLYAVNPQYIPTLAQARNSPDVSCDGINGVIQPKLLTLLPSPSFSRQHKTAIVMVHGWQTTGGVKKGQYGDTGNIYPQCRSWIRVMAAYKHIGGDWKTLRNSTDLFTVPTWEGKSPQLQLAALAK